MVAATRALLGRQHVIEQLVQGVLEGHATLLHGPIGVGKTAVLLEVAARLRQAGHECAFVARTASRTDIKAALAKTAYPRGGRVAGLLLDGLVSATGPMRTFLHWMQGRGTGILIAIDVAQARDHQRARRMRLAYREVALQPLEPRLIRELLAGLALPALVNDLAHVAGGLPGRAHLAAELAPHARYWANGQLMRNVLETDVDTEMMRRLLITPG